MVTNVLRSLIENDKETKKLEKMADRVFSYADEMAFCSVTKQLQAKLLNLKERYNREKHYDLLYEAYAVVRRIDDVLGLYPYKFRLWGIVLHNGDVPEMRTGEGKTLTATMPVYLNALSGKVFT